MRRWQAEQKEQGTPGCSWDDDGSSQRHSATQEVGGSFLRPFMPSGTSVCRMEPYCTCDSRSLRLHASRQCIQRTEREPSRRLRATQSQLRGWWKDSHAPITIPIECACRLSRHRRSDVVRKCDSQRADCSLVLHVFALPKNTSSLGKSGASDLQQTQVHYTADAMIPPPSGPRLFLERAQVQGGFENEAGRVVERACS